MNLNATYSSNWAYISRKYTFLRLIIALSGGIICMDQIESLLPFLITGIFSLLLLVSSCFIKENRKSALFGTGVLLSVFSAGGILTSFEAVKTKADIPLEGTYHAIAENYPIEKKKSFQCQLHIRSVVINGKETDCDKRIISYIGKDSLSASIEPGEEIIFKADLNPLKGSGTFSGYENFLRREGFCASTYIASEQWERSDLPPVKQVSYIALKYRRKLSKLFEDSVISAKARPILLAMTLGAVELLDTETKDNFSVSGVSHLLAVSGLNVGILILLLNIFLHGMNLNEKSRITKEFILLLSIWIYAFITGLSPSVVRAVIMFSFVILGHLLHRKINIYHSLLLSAFGMLLYNPYYLFNISFQLSFTALFSIVLFQPKLNGLIRTKNRILKYFWEITNVSIAAQICTFPLILYYFHSFPTHFLVTNIILVPLSFVLLGIVILSYMTLLIPFVGKFFLIAAGMIGDFFYTTTAFIHNLPCAILQVPAMTPLEVIILYATLFFFSIWTIYHNRKSFIGALASILLLLLVS
ncbi:MAG: ComEC/Rec2 family competence protein [Bacteroidales bacterium]|nr:ComEC/Rec2 family competence protein [Bacteroidales bacterium]MDD4822540.1 ComEC/Rec2 family competence protein [Bacteroidales bacterium]